MKLLKIISDLYHTRTPEILDFRKQDIPIKSKREHTQVYDPNHRRALNSLADSSTVRDRRRSYLGSAPDQHQHHRQHRPGTPIIIHANLVRGWGFV